jgi:hypothetical protein
MSIPTHRFDSESIHPSIYRGISKCKAPPVGYQKYIFYDAEGVNMGELLLRDRYATPESEQMLFAFHEMNDPAEVVNPRDLLRLEA